MPLPTQAKVPNLSGERFRVVYRIQGDDPAQVERIAHGAALEQTVELPDELVPRGDIADQIVGQIEAVEPLVGAFDVTISYAVESAGSGLTQLMNVMFGNTSMQPGIQVRSLDLPASITHQFRGPRFGTDGLRALLNVHDRPLLCTALKPMGLSAEALASIAYDFAMGGIDIIKDDHGLANQPFCPFEERAARCAEAVARANRETGGHTLYAPNITAPVDQLLDRARFARDVGAGALEISYGLTGFDAMRMVADDDRIALPILAHPALSGSFVTASTQGIAHYVTYGQLVRLAGGDVTIFVSYGGRFPYTQAQCREVMAGCTVPMGKLAPIFPAPSGGMTLSRLSELHAFYGRDTAFLIAGGLYTPGPDLQQNAFTFVQSAAQL